MSRAGLSWLLGRDAPALGVAAGVAAGVAPITAPELTAPAVSPAEQTTAASTVQAPHRPHLPSRWPSQTTRRPLPQAMRRPCPPR
ncbi:hypothetical protein T492DRAFT_205412 [Pavlovales sp. CCMP2436]|nr:hypothetical protein T492DRAFT_205412 [Pavlovales sp. CCMP2436]